MPNTFGEFLAGIFTTENVFLFLMSVILVGMPKFGLLDILTGRIVLDTSTEKRRALFKKMKGYIRLPVLAAIALLILHKDVFHLGLFFTACVWFYFFVPWLLRRKYGALVGEKTEKRDVRV